MTANTASGTKAPKRIPFPSLFAGLRREAKHAEADKALAEFRKRYPDYRIAEPMLERVERR